MLLQIHDELIFEVKKDELSMEEARVSIQLNPNQFQPHAILGDLLFFSNQDNAALKEYELAALLNPEYIIVYKNIGFIKTFFPAAFIILLNYIF
jgi:hypothetical protein